MSNLIKEEEKFVMIIPSYMEEKIRIACTTLPDVEWSGVLFYTYKGSFTGKDKLVVTCEDFLMMDIGTSTYTEWEANPDIATYKIDRMLLNCQMGIIHSHNKMTTFFSGTDTSTLVTEGTSRNNFVSLIVNNAGSYSAAITRKVKCLTTVTKNGKYSAFGKKDVSWKCKETNDETLILSNEFQIIRASSNIEEDCKRILELKALKKKTSTSVTAVPSTSEFTVLKTSREEDFLKNILTQIVTGNILASFRDYHLDNWVNNSMERMLDERFSDIKDYQDFMLSYIDFFMISEDPLLAYKLLGMLEGFQSSNKYLNVIKNLLKDYE